MCQVHILCKIGSDATIEKKDVQAFFSLLTNGSFSNKDAYGFFCEDYMFRRGEAFYEESQQTIGGLAKNILSHEPKFLVGHNRLTTQGSEEKNFNNHPFPSEDWIIVHNGVLNNDTVLSSRHDLEYEEETDSAIIVNLLQKFSDAGNTPLESVKMVAEELSGSFSVCAYHKKKNKLYYFKNSSTDFAFRLFEMKNGSRVLVGSTKKRNFDEVYLTPHMIFWKPEYKTYFETDAESEVIYEISNSGIGRIDEFDAKSYKYGKSAYQGTKSVNNPKKKWAVYGGYRQENWEDIGGFESARDIECMNDEGELLAIAGQLEVRDANLKHDIENMVRIIEDSLGVEVGQAVPDLHNDEVVLTFHDSPVGMGEICSQLRQHDIQVSPEGNNSITIEIDEIREVTK